MKDVKDGGELYCPLCGRELLKPKAIVAIMAEINWASLPKELHWEMLFAECWRRHKCGKHDKRPANEDEE